MDPTMRVSPETIYAALYVLPRRALKLELLSCLRQQRKYRRKKLKRARGEKIRGTISSMVSIDERPATVDERRIPGHWEGDLLIGKNKRSALGTLVERTTRVTLLVPLRTKSAAAVRMAFAHTMERLPKELRLSLTYDQGREMIEHKLFTATTKIHVYFAHPASPWERGTSENTNGLIRQFFPKGTDFSTISKKEIKQVQDLLNGRPRKVLHWETPQEAMSTSVALET